MIHDVDSDGNYDCNNSDCDSNDTQKRYNKHVMSNYIDDNDIFCSGCLYLERWYYQLLSVLVFHCLRKDTLLQFNERYMELEIATMQIILTR